MKPSVLYVEDDAFNRNVMRFLLVEHLSLDHVVIWEDSKRFEHNLDQLGFIPDIVLLDIHVEPLDGFAMLNILSSKEGYQHIPVVAVTASVMNEEVARVKDAGFRGVISKPIDIDLFPDYLQRFLDGEEIWR